MDRDAASALIARLTSKELEALELVAAHFGSKEIANHLGLSSAAIDARIRAVLRKLEVTDRRQAALVLAAARAGEPGPSPQPPSAQKDRFSADSRFSDPYQSPTYQSPQVPPQTVRYQMDGPIGHDLRDVHQGFPVEFQPAVAAPVPSGPPGQRGARNQLNASQRVGRIAAIAIGSILALGGMISAMNGLVQIVVARGQLL